MQAPAGRGRVIAVSVLAQEVKYLLMLQGLAQGLAKRLAARYWDRHIGMQGCNISMYWRM